MRAVVYTEVGAIPEVLDVADPRCPDDGVVLEVGATGVCRSDWHAWRGHEEVALPHIPGHELAGTVVQVLLGGGRRLFADSAEQVELAPVRRLDGRDATHLRYRVVR